MKLVRILSKKTDNYERYVSLEYIKRIEKINYKSYLHTVYDETEKKWVQVPYENDEFRFHIWLTDPNDGKYGEYLDTFYEISEETYNRIIAESEIL